MQEALKEGIKEKAHRLGFILAGVTSPDPPPHYSTLENWLAQGHHGTMDYLPTERSRIRRAKPLEILPECKSILVLATPYSPPSPFRAEQSASEDEADEAIKGEGKIASYAWGDDYHDILPARMKEL